MSRYRQILQSATEFAVVATDRDGTITDWNTGAERIFGWTASEMIGGDATRFFTPEDQVDSRIGKEMAAALADGTGIDERWHLKADGTRFWASGEMMPLREEDGSHVGFIKILRDRTERHLAGVRFDELQAQLQQAQEAGGVGLFTVDIATSSIEATSEFSRLYGLEHIDRRPSQDFEALVINADQALVSTDVSRRAGEAVADVRYRIRRADTGEIRWIARKAELQFDTDGRAVRFSGVARDITVQINAEMRVAESEARWRGLSEVGEALLGPTDLDEMAVAASAVIGRTFGVGRVGYGVLAEDGETFTVPSDWTQPPFPSLAGVYRMDDYGAYAEDLRQGRTVVIPDIRLDPRTSQETGPLEQVSVRALVNIPIVENNRTVAILYVNDGEPRNWSSEDIAFLTDAAARIRAAVERRRAETLLRESDERQRLALAIGEVGTFDLNLVTGKLIWDDKVRAAFGVFAGRAVSQAEKLGAVHSSDRAEFDAAFRSAMNGGVFDLRFRTVGLDDAIVRWVAVQGRVIGDQDTGQHFIGAVRDVSERVAAEERRGVLNAELAHRLKNTLAMVSSIVTQTLRTAPDVASARKILTDRIHALSKAHDVLMTGQRDAATIREVVQSASSLHDNGGRLHLKGPNIPLGPKASLTLSLITHELSTNAGKYGALSVEGGYVDVVWSIQRGKEERQPVLSFEWREVGGPPVVPPTKESFGTRLIRMGLSGTSEGSSELVYAPDGLHCRITARLTELQIDDEANADD